MKDGQTNRDNVDYSAFLDFLSTTAVNITRRVTGLELVPSEKVSFDMSDVASLSVKTSGDFRISFVLIAPTKVFREIARRMKRQDKVSLGDVEIYSGEYFNILFGSFVSYVNNTQHTKTRFHIPHFSEGIYPSKFIEDNGWTILPFDCPYGYLEFRIRDLEAG